MKVCDHGEPIPGTCYECEAYVPSLRCRLYLFGRIPVSRVYVGVKEGTTEGVRWYLRPFVVWGKA